MKELTIFNSLESNEQYEEFVNKFKAKKTTDDCFTPTAVYEAVAAWVRKRYDLHGAEFVRPFYPGGDYEHFDYPDGCIVVDNPPFSIISKILRFYRARHIRFFMFAPHLTLFGSLKQKGITALPEGVTVTYANGAVVNTSFLTNMTPDTLVERSGELYRVIKEANEKCNKATVKVQRLLEYDKHLLNSARFGSLRDADYILSTNDAVFTKKLFGGGVIVNSHKSEEFWRERERQRERERIELTEQERATIEYLDKNITK